MDVIEELARDELENVKAHGGPTWTHAEFERDFDLVGFVEPDLVVARRKADGQSGTLWYVATRDGWPRLYFDFTP